MESPKFVGPHANLAAVRWSHLNFSRGIINGLNNVSKRVLLRQTELYDTMDFTDGVILNLTHLSKKEGENIEDNYSELDYLFDSLMDVPQMPESLALALARKHGSVDKIIGLPPEKLTEITFQNHKGKWQKISLNVAKKILGHLARYV